MVAKYRYVVPDMEAAHRLGEIARAALEAARARAPNQREHAVRLFREIYGPLPPRPCDRETTDRGGRAFVWRLKAILAPAPEAP